MDTKYPMQIAQIFHPKEQDDLILHTCTHRYAEKTKQTLHTTFSNLKAIPFHTNLNKMNKSDTLFVINNSQKI